MFVARDDRKYVRINVKFRLLTYILSTETALFVDRSLHFLVLSMKRRLFMERK